MLHGRGAERARLHELVDAARKGHGRALVVHGEAGTGKSVLLEDVASGLAGVTVLHTQGIESEAPLPFAALQRLLRPALRYADRLPPPQSLALRVAFGEEVGEADRFLVFLGALGLLAEAAEQRPVVALVDDAHWLDDASAAALLFVARRLELERVALVFAVRDGDVRTFEAPDLDQVPLAGLGLGDVAALVNEHAEVDVATEVAAQLLASTGGNPLALVELPRVLSADQLAGRSPLPGRLPVTSTLERVFLDRARRLSPAAQRLLLVASADDSTQVRTVLAAAAALGAGADALGEAEGSGLLAVEGGALRMRHPLVRSALYTAATSADRRAAHGALADAMTGSSTGTDDADRQAWHLAEAATGPDDTVAAALDDAAQRALRRSGYEAASATFERASGLTVSDDSRARRLHAAAASAWLAGQPGRTGALAAEGRLCATDPVLRADLDRLRGRAEFHVGSIPTAVRLWTQATRDIAQVEPLRALPLGVMACAASTFAAPPDRTDLDPAELAVDLALEPPAEPAAGPPGEPPAEPAAGPGTELDPRAAPRERCLAGLLTGFHHLLAGRLPTATAPLRVAFAVAPDVPDPDLANAIGIASFHLSDDDTFRRTFTSLLTHARERAAYGLVLFALPRLALADFCAGRLGDAVADASEARQLALSSGQVALSAMPLAELALYAAFRGDDQFDEHLAELDRVVAGHQVGVLGALVDDARRWAVGERELMAGRYADAVHHLAQLRTPPMVHLTGYPRLEAAVRADRLDLARTWWDELWAFATAVDSPAAHAVVAHGAALLAGDEAEQHFRAALEHHADSGRPIEAARTRLAYGEFLRRRRQRVAAREHLRAALNTFEDVGAAPFAERARQDLRASGETARKRDASTGQDLTPQERQVAKFVASGLSNRDVAAQLFVSPRTVDFHLRNVFAKTGVTSRTELAQLALA
ncbi:MAG TPA: AAA family ATPase [Segeticoccus sp.]|uniref:helix-turn-helix transcriptional regulator n=1 Tax=Segeticoccus sp. TaxID=2706531 RepID=UPI002D7E153B|nr:AAA family ATPase [Segeticoccus sp.]HET8598875.1 AAA family ATPase [Segeticoccus sp.]